VKKKNRHLVKALKKKQQRQLKRLGGGHKVVADEEEEDTIEKRQPKYQVFTLDVSDDSDSSDYDTAPSKTKTYQQKLKRRQQAVNVKSKK